ncbi:MAG: tetratricopeptide repeat protein [Magnetococcales bacterium]|nr:tetratricopeptide repeat protein [Magnetococcales bacterium]
MNRSVRGALRRLGVALLVLAVWIGGGGISPALALQMNTCPMAREMALKGVDLFDSQPQKGLAALQEAFGFCPADLSIRYNLGLAHYLSGDKPKARDLWRKLLEPRPEDVKTIANLAWTHFDLGDDDSAHIVAFRGLAKFPDNMALAHTKVFSLFRMGRYLEAFDWLTRSKLTGIQVGRWREQAGHYVVETVWRQFRDGERKEAVARAVQLAKDYTDFVILEAKNKMVQAMVDPDAEVPYPIALPHESWAKSGDILEGQETLDELIQAQPTLNPWVKRFDAFAMVSGIYQYQNMRGRPFADRDAVNLQKLLVRRGQFIDDNDHVRLRINKEATHRVLASDLEWLMGQGRINPNALLLFYFSGNGLVWKDPAGGKSEVLLAPVEVRPEEISPTNALSLSRIKQELDTLPNKEVILLVESCFNPKPGCAWPGEGPSTAPPPEFLVSAKPFGLAAQNAEAGVWGPGRQSAFTYFLLKGLLGAGDGRAKQPKDGWVDLREAVDYAQQQLSERNMSNDALFSQILPLRLIHIGGER